MSSVARPIRAHHAQQVSEAVFSAALAAAFSEPGVDHPVPSMPWIVVTLVASDRLVARLKNSGCAIQDPDSPIAARRAQGLALAHACDVLGAPTCANTLRGYLPDGVSWALLVDPDNERVYLCTVRDRRVVGAS